MSIEAPSDTQDASGQPSTNWSLVAVVDASIEPLTGRELANAQMTWAEVTTRIMVRYIAGLTSAITPKNRITWNGKVYDIMAALNLEERNILIEIMAKELIGAGLNGQCE